MLSHLALALLALLPMQGGTPPATDPLDAEWNAAMALKQASKWNEGAAAFQGFSKAHPDSPRAAQALLEAGVCWIGLAKSQQVLHRNTPESKTTFGEAGKLFARVATEKAADPVAPRAQYLCGQVALYLDDPSGALEVFDKALETVKPGDEYVAKLLEKRGFARRMLLDNAGAVVDLAKNLELRPTAPAEDPVRRALRYAQSLDRPAPAWQADHWAFSDPLTPESLRGEVVVVCFFASWCDKCAREREFEKDLKQRYTELGVRFVGVVQPWTQHDGKTRHTLESFTDFAAKAGYGFPLLLDSGAGPGATAAAFGCESLPDMALIGRDGRVRWHDHPSMLLDSTLEKLLLEEPPKPR